MTEAEARVVALICLSADGGCSVCAARLIYQFTNRFPEWRDLFREAYLSEYPYPSEIEPKGT